MAGRERSGSGQTKRHFRLENWSYGLIEVAYDHRAEVIVTSCPLGRFNVEIHQDEINAKFDSNFSMPMVYYGQLISVACGCNVVDLLLDGQIIKAKKLEESAVK